MIHIILCIFVISLIILMFSDGFEKGLATIIFLVCFVVLPVYFMIYLNSILALFFGFIVGFVISLAFGIVVDKLNGFDNKM